MRSCYAGWVSDPTEPPLRDKLACQLGCKLANLLGPYPDEVGWLLAAAIYVAKLLLLGTVFWNLVDLVLPKSLGDDLAVQFLVCGFLMVVLGWLLPEE